MKGPERKELRPDLIEADGICNAARWANPLENGIVVAAIRFFGLLNVVFADLVAHAGDCKCLHDSQGERPHSLVNCDLGGALRELHYVVLADHELRMTDAGPIGVVGAQ